MMKQKKSDSSMTNMNSKTLKMCLVEDISEIAVVRRKHKRTEFSENQRERSLDRGIE